MTNSELERINFLAKKQKSEGLTPAEAEEQAALRKSYIAGFRSSLKSQLDNIVIQNEDGTKRKLRRKGE